MAMRYKIVRKFFKRGDITLRRELTLEEAQAHCDDPETSSKTCQKYAGCKRLERLGHWFDTFYQD
jgi:hypothetical protein